MKLENAESQYPIGLEQKRGKIEHANWRNLHEGNDIIICRSTSKKP